MNLELRGKLLEAVGRDDSLGDLPFLFLPCRKIQLLVVAESSASRRRSCETVSTLPV
jgi:hypothetical protein